MEMVKKALLVIDDESSIIFSLRMIFKHRDFDDYSVVAYQEPSEAINYLKTASNTTSVILLDMKIGDVSGVDVIRQLRESRIEVPVILMTAFKQTHDDVAAVKGHISGYIEKPFDVTAVRTTVLGLLQKAG